VIQFSEQMPNWSSPTGDGVFRWRDKNRWRREIRQLFADIINNDVIASIRSHPPESIVGDDLSWLTEPMYSITGFDEDLFEEFENRFPERFPLIYAFHGCRPLNWKSYQIQGLCLSNTAALRCEAKKIFGKSDALQTVLNEVEVDYVEYNEGYIYLCLDRWELVRRSGHYLKYGSEYLYCVARKLDLERLLKERGIPTLIHCKLFYDWLTPKFRKDLMGIIFEDLFSYLLGEPMEDSNYLLFSIKVQKPIPPQNIIHMEQVKNFHSSL